MGIGQTEQRQLLIAKVPLVFDELRHGRVEAFRLAGRRVDSVRALVNGLDGRSPRGYEAAKDESQNERRNQDWSGRACHVNSPCNFSRVSQWIGGRLRSLDRSDRRQGLPTNGSDLKILRLRQNVLTGPFEQADRRSPQLGRVRGRVATLL